MLVTLSPVGGPFLGTIALRWRISISTGLRQPGREFILRAL
jgi:hypothetical protein